jgi:predicted extracellular nuclease
MKTLYILSLNLSILLTQDLFFSEYIEGSRYIKAVEIINPANTEIDLTGYEVWKVTNSVGSWVD